MKSIIRKYCPKAYNATKQIYHSCIREPFKNLITMLFTRHAVCDVRDIIIREHDNGEFNCYDMIVRLLAIENYYGLNDNGFKLYEKQQNARHAEEWETAVPRFKALIKSYEEHGYNKDSEITIGRDGRLWDGSHRMAFAFFRKEYMLSCKIVPFTRKTYYGINWHKANNFTPEEIEQIENRYKRLIDEHFEVKLFKVITNPDKTIDPKQIDNIKHNIKLKGGIVL